MPKSPHSRRQALSLAAGIPLAALWIGLTASTGKTYHLAPLLVGAAPGAVSRRLGVRAGGAIWAGVASVGVAWLAIVAAGVEPSATIFERQPGGVPAEVVVFAALGLVIGVGRGPTWLAGRLLRAVTQAGCGPGPEMDSERSRFNTPGTTLPRRWRWWRRRARTSESRESNRGPHSSHPNA